MSDEVKTQTGVPRVLAQLADLRSQCGILKKKDKQGVRFKVRSADDLNDKVRPLAIKLGLLIYPVKTDGVGYAVEDGTLASVNLTVRIQSVEDGSFIDIAGFGLGADTQDKAGGKAGTYAWKAAVGQALLAMGESDTDDTDTPIAGGVKKKGSNAGKPTVDTVRAAVTSATDEPSFGAALKMAAGLTLDQQKEVQDDFRSARERLGLTKPTTK